MATTGKSPVFVEAGRRGAAKRWSDPDRRKVVRIDSLTTEQRALVLALVRAAKATDDPDEGPVAA